MVTTSKGKRKIYASFLTSVMLFGMSDHLGIILVTVVDTLRNEKLKVNFRHSFAILIHYINTRLLWGLFI